MDRQKIIEGLIEFRTMLECCFEAIPNCDECPVKETCMNFSDSNYMHTLDILDAAVEMLKKDEKGDRE